MKVLLINTFETRGGAAVACKRLALALQKQGVEVSLLVRDKETSDPFISSVVTSFYKKTYAKIAFVSERLQIFLANRLKKDHLFAVSTASTGFKILNNPLVQEADVIHLHWVNQGFLSLQEIGNLVKLGKPVIWTMHDMWPMTGICHHSGDCDRFKVGCGECKYMIKPFQHDLSHQVFHKKKRQFGKMGISYVSCSQWLRTQTEESLLMEGNQMTSIPNPINTEIFTPGDKLKVRQELKLPLNKKLILFGAAVVSDKRKGIDYLIKATQNLTDLYEDVELVFVGEVKEKISEIFGLKTHSLGYLSDQDTIVKMYQAVDCFVTPSLEENLPNMIMEAMSCGVPCIGFNIGGIPEMITHQKNGYIAQYKSAEDLALGIRSILEKSDDLSFRQTVREFVLANYSEPVIARQYIQLYQNNHLFKK
ncbi:MAG: glycosyltransferase family 4 protein [Bacteroidales bacterium]|nr:glycosyltransferase family 4 protein [Bacteroidales bacterium]